MFVRPPVRQKYEFLDCYFRYTALIFFVKIPLIYKYILYTLYYLSACRLCNIKYTISLISVRRYECDFFQRLSISNSICIFFMTCLFCWSLNYKIHIILNIKMIFFQLAYPFFYEHL